MSGKRLVEKLARLLSLTRVNIEYYAYKDISLNPLLQGIQSQPLTHIESGYIDDVLNRISNSYKKMKMYNKYAEAPYLPGHKWKAEIEQKRKKYIFAIENADNNALKYLFTNFFRNDGVYSLLKYATYSELDKGNIVKLDLKRKEYVLNIVKDIGIWKAEVQNLGVEQLRLPQVGNPFGYEFEGVLITAASCPLNYYSWKIKSLLHGIETPIVGEIGGGFGGLAYYLLNDNENITYVDFDLPEVLVIAQFFLMCSFPKRKFLLFGEDDHMEISMNTLSAYDIVLMPNYMLPKLASSSIDLMVNTHSLSEMDYPTVEEYIYQIQRVCKLFFYHENSDVEHDIGNGNLELPASRFPIADTEFELISKTKAIWREPRYWEYLFRRV